MSKVYSFMLFLPCQHGVKTILILKTDTSNYFSSSLEWMIVRMFLYEFFHHFAINFIIKRHDRKKRKTGILGFSRGQIGLSISWGEFGHSMATALRTMVAAMVAVSVAGVAAALAGAASAVADAAAAVAEAAVAVVGTAAAVAEAAVAVAGAAVAIAEAAVAVAGAAAALVLGPVFASGTASGSQSN
jgi:hypothetical protein